MSRPCGFRVAWTAVLVLAAGCQNYNFNPVGHCVVQPGSQTFTLSNISTADVLFVIDDSGSMEAEQERLAQAFSAFIDNLDQTNASRASAGLQPIDFHLAVTTTSIFHNYASTGPLSDPTRVWTCKQDCGGAGQVCCTDDNEPVKAPRPCTSPSQCGGYDCREDCTFTYDWPPNGPYDLKGEKYCCNEGQQAPLLDNVPCSAVGKRCGTFQRHYDFYSCQPGISAGDGYPYPGGSFVGAGANPRVLHFDKDLYPAESSGTPTNRQGFTSASLVDFFRGNSSGINANVKAGTCGSPQEQAFEAARIAVEKALAGQQTDTYSMSGQQTASQAEWPHESSKLVLVFVGDEDDCSSPSTDASTGVVLLGTDTTGTDDACTRDEEGKQYDVVARYVDYFMGLGRPVGAAFIVSTAEKVCGRDDGGGVAACTAGRCCQDDCPDPGTCSTTTSGPFWCGGQGAGSRFLTAADAFRSRGADVVTGSICDARFDLLLNEIARIVKPPSGLVLPTLPAEDDITVLRIADSADQTVKLCDRPAPQGMSAAEAAAAGYQWWFTATESPPDPVPSGVSRYVHINPAGSCIANPGQTYSAEYIGRMPASGCQTETDCRNALGGSTDSWTCFAGTQLVDGVEKCSSTVSVTGTCLCGSVLKNCPGGKL